MCFSVWVTPSCAHLWGMLPLCDPVYYCIERVFTKWYCDDLNTEQHFTTFCTSIVLYILRIVYEHNSMHHWMPCCKSKGLNWTPVWIFSPHNSVSIILHIYPACHQWKIKHDIFLFFNPFTTNYIIWNAYSNTTFRRCYLYRLRFSLVQCIHINAMFCGSCAWILTDW